MPAQPKRLPDQPTACTFSDAGIHPVSRDFGRVAAFLFRLFASNKEAACKSEALFSL